ncbi:hypothetical protein [Streptomyces sp. NRRL F-2580]|uniref:hypothetical protein n=1 Tax=Streptomyces sp. NRRL F-2580 TaxID=1463841 RepID=UPI00056C319F|nr:hypothetical protein [Streptomyces sp. NRRL F-2580]
MLPRPRAAPRVGEGIKTGALPQAVKKLMDTVKPEAACFGLHEGVRSCWIVLDLDDSSPS